MQVFIDNEEVLCASKMTIQEQLKNTSSVILNNVYPLSWENDKDYVSNFYMPKDYSHCKIINENTAKKVYSLKNNVQFIDNRYYRNGELKYENCSATYLRLVPGLTYHIKLTNHATLTGYTFTLWNSDSMNIGTTATFLTNVQVNSSKELDITPTKEYVFITSRYYSVDPCVTIDDITIEVTDNLIFSGLIKNSGNINLNPRYPHYATLQLLDYKTLLSEGDMLNYVLDSQTVSSAINEVIKNLKGFYIGEINIENDSTMAPYNCNEKTPYDVFEYFAEITGSIWYTKAINENIVLIYFTSTDNLEIKGNIEYNSDYFKNNDIIDISYSYNSKDYRNKQAIISDNMVSNVSQVEYLTYNGKDMITTYPISSVESITRGTKVYSVANVMAKNNGSYADFYYSANYIEANASIETGTVLKVTYKAKVKSRQVSYNQSEIERISNSTGRNGIIARYEKRGDTTNEEALAQIGQTYLDYKGVPEIIVNVRSRNNLFNVSDVVFFNGPLESLKTNYLVIEKQIEMIVTGNQKEIFYTFKLSSSFNDENAINYFDNQRRKLTGNIEEGQYISRYIDLPSSTNIIFYDLNFEEITIPNDVLDGELEVELEGE